MLTRERLPPACMTNYRLEGSSECTPLTKAVAVLSADHPLTDAELLTLRPSEYQLITGKKKKTMPVGQVRLVGFLGNTHRLTQVLKWSPRVMSGSVSKLSITAALINT